MPTQDLSRTAAALLTAALLLAPWTASPLIADDENGKKKKDLPLALEETFELETDEGTWISLDITPDGKNVIFDLLGDLYRVPLEGGDAVRVTEGAGFDSQPRISPDGEWIAFITDRDGNDNLWIAKIDGSEPRQLSREKKQGMVSPAWTPDGQYVIATRRGRNTALLMYHVDGGSGVDLAGEKKGPPGGGGPPGGPRGPNRLGAVMDPDGRFLYFAQSIESQRGIFPFWQIARRDMTTGDVDVLTQALGSAIRPELSPDGRLLVYATRHETKTALRVRDLTSGEDRWLLTGVVRDEQESGRAPSRDLFPSYAFTPDGQEVVVTFDGKIHRVDVTTSAVTPVPFKAKIALDVGPDLTFPYRVEQGPVRARLIHDPRLAPDGEKLAFSVLTKLYVMDQGGEPARLTTDDAWEFKPAWSPDGEWIAYVTWSMTGGHVWKTRADGSGTPVRLSEHTAFYTDLAFSPDGTRLVGLRGNAFMRHQTDSEFGGLRIPLDLVWLNAGDGPGPVHLVTPARGIGAPHFAGEDPERIYVYSEDGLLSLRYDGTDRRVHLKVTGPKSPFSREPLKAQSVLLHPAGGWALAKVVNQLHVIAVPPVGGKAAPTVSVTGGKAAVPTARITDIGADYFAWADGGKTLTWSIGSTFYRRPFDSLEFRKEEKDKDGEKEDEDGDDKDGKDKDDKDEEKPKDPLDLHESVEAVEIVLEFPRSVPNGTIVLRHATVITMEGDEIVDDADLVVKDNRIAALGKSGTVEIPAGAREIDADGTFIVPGFVDTHAHWEFRTHDVLEPQNWSLVANLAYGVTAGLDVQTSTNDYFAYQDLVETGQSIGERAFMTGPGIFSMSDFQSYEATLSYLKRYKHHYRTPNIKSYMVGHRQQRQWVVQAAQELELMPTTEGGRDMKLDLTHAVDGFHGNEHSLPVTPLYKDVVELYAQTKTAYTPTLLVLYGGPMARGYFFTRYDIHDDPKIRRFYPHNTIDRLTRRRTLWVRDDENSFDEIAAQAAKIQRAGGLVGVGGHGELQGLGYHWEMWALAMGGMTPREVLQAATLDGARIIGVHEDLGSLAEGKLADLIVLEKNPLGDIRNTTSIRYVMKNGELYEGETLDQIWPVERELPSFWWWDDGPPSP